MQNDTNVKNKDQKKKEQYKVIKTYSEDGEPFQKVMERILINKLNKM